MNERASGCEDRGRARDRHERIIAAPAHLSAERGFKNITVRDVADAAGVSHPLIYHYWSSKEELLAAAVERSPSLVRRFPAGRPDPLDAIVGVSADGREHARGALLGGLWNVLAPVAPAVARDTPGRGGIG